MGSPVLLRASLLEGGARACQSWMKPALVRWISNNVSSVFEKAPQWPLLSGMICPVLIKWGSKKSLNSMDDLRFAAWAKSDLLPCPDVPEAWIY